MSDLSNSGESLSNQKADGAGDSSTRAESFPQDAGLGSFSNVKSGDDIKKMPSSSSESESKSMSSKSSSENHSEKSGDADVFVDVDETRVTRVETEVTRYVDVPVVEEKVRYVQKEVELVKENPIVEIEYVEKVVEVPRVEYVDKVEEVEQVVEQRKFVPVHQVVETAKEVIKYVPREEVKEVEKCVEVPGEIVEVEQVEYVDVEDHHSVYLDKRVPVVFKQTVEPVVVVDESRSVEVDVRRFNPVHIPVDVYVERPVLPPAQKAKKTVRHRKMSEVGEVPRYNSMMLYLNQHLLGTDHEQNLPFMSEFIGGENRVTFLPGRDPIHAFEIEDDGNIEGFKSKVALRPAVDYARYSDKSSRSGVKRFFNKKGASSMEARQAGEEAEKAAKAARRAAKRAVAVTQSSSASVKTSKSSSGSTSSSSKTHTSYATSRTSQLQKRSCFLCCAPTARKSSADRPSYALASSARSSSFQTDPQFIPTNLSHLKPPEPQFGSSFTVPRLQVDGIDPTRSNPIVGVTPPNWSAVRA